MNNELNEINKKEYKTLTPFKGWVIENFPFIEADFDAITNYQLICKVTEYLNTVIYNQNQVQNLSNELVDGYNNLLNYVNTYFENLDIQEEVNTKIDDMAIDGTLTNLIKGYVDPIYQNYENRINNEINSMQEEINSVVSGSPLVASSTSEMTDTSRIYVNTTDGYWYYYNGTQWTQGSLYQATRISNDSITKYMLNNELKNAIYKEFGTELDISNCQSDLHVIKSTSGLYYATVSGTYLLVVPVESSTTYEIRKTLGAKFRAYTSVNFPANNVVITNNQNNDGETSISITTGESDNYLGIYYYATSTDSEYTPAQILATIKVYKDEIVNSETQAEYLTNEINKPISRYKLDNELKNAIFKHIGNEMDLSNCQSVEAIKDLNNDYYVTSVSISGVKTLVVPVDANNTYYVKKIKSERFRLYLSTNYPANNVTINSTVRNDTATELQISTTSGDNYLGIYYYASSVDTLTPEEILSTIKVYKNDVDETVTQAEYLDNNIISDKFIKLVSYSPLGEFESPLIAISSDDGANSLADITVDIFKGYKTTYNKNIPLTMALMSSSAIFNDSTRKAKVLDLITNYGASVAIHGATSYTQYTTDELFNFLDEQKAYLTTNLAAPTSIIFPNHAYNERTSTIAGTYYGVACTGGTQLGTNYLNRPRTNRYTLYRFSLFNASMTTNIIKTAIDFCYEHNLVFMPFFHDNTLRDEYDRCKPLLDYCVSYANSKGFRFVNVGDLVNLRY